MATKKAAAKTAEKETTKVTKAAEKETKTAAKATKTATKTTATKAAAEKKAPAKKAAPKKIAPKKPAETKVDFYVEFGGVQVSIDEVIANVKTTLGTTAKEIKVYLKPEESKAYFVADGEEKEMDVYFC